ncbi:DUF2336 domain-containing protein, partial [Rhizobium ruizarguesonis]
IAPREIPDLVQHLQLNGRLTPSFLMHALCAGQVDFFAGAIVALTACPARLFLSLLSPFLLPSFLSLSSSSFLPLSL